MQLSGHVCPGAELRKEVVVTERTLAELLMSRDGKAPQKRLVTEQADREPSIDGKRSCGASLSDVMPIYQSIVAAVVMCVCHVKNHNLHCYLTPEAQLHVTCCLATIAFHADFMQLLTSQALLKWLGKLC